MKSQTQTVIPFPVMLYVAIPPELNTQEFVVSWTEWLDYKATDKKQPMSPRAQRAQLTRMIPWGPEKAIESMLWSIERNWDGVWHCRDGAEVGRADKQPIALRSVRDILEVQHAKRERIDAIKRDKNNLAPLKTEPWETQKYRLKPEAQEEVNQLLSEINQLAKDKANLK